MWRSIISAAIHCSCGRSLSSGTCTQLLHRCMKPALPGSGGRLAGPQQSAHPSHRQPSHCAASKPLSASALWHLLSQLLLRQSQLCHQLVLNELLCWPCNFLLRLLWQFLCELQLSLWPAAWRSEPAPQLHRAGVLR